MDDTKCKVKVALPQVLKMCFSCFRVKGEDGRWLLMGKVSVPSNPSFFHGLCPTCCKKLNLKEINNFYISPKLYSHTRSAEQLELRIKE